MIPAGQRSVQVNHVKDQEGLTLLSLAFACQQSSAKRTRVQLGRMLVIPLNRRHSYHLLRYKLCLESGCAENESHGALTTGSTLSSFLAIELC